MSKILTDLLYTEDHEWVKVDGNKAKIGITDHAQHELGDIVYVELPEEDDELAKGDVFGVIESVKAASDSFTPLSGTVTAINEDLEDAPESVNADPYGAWMFELELSDTSELDGLMDAAAYEKFCEE
jgi:glycine cleavage system H protein